MINKKFLLKYFSLKFLNLKKLKILSKIPQEINHQMPNLACLLKIAL
jgi:hypothetical protein